MSTLKLTILVLAQLTYTMAWSVPFRCFITDSQCLMKLSQITKKPFYQGLPEIGLESNDPMFIDNAKIYKDGLMIDLKNISVTGMGDAITDYFFFDLPNKVVRIGYHVDLVMNAQYKADGFLNSLPFNGEGDTSSIYKNLYVDMVVPYDIVRKADGKEYLEPLTYDFNFDFKSQFNVQYNNLYYGDKERSDKMNFLINNNWKALSVQFGRIFLNPIVEKSFYVWKSFLQYAPLDNFVVY